MRTSGVKYKNYKQGCREAVEEVSRGCRERVEDSPDEYDDYLATFNVLGQLQSVIY
jgi:hypothetical protein